MSRNNVIAVAHYRSKYYVLGNLNMDTEFNVESIRNLILSGTHIFIKERGRALCYAHDIQKIIVSEYGVIEIDIDG